MDSMVYDTYETSDIILAACLIVIGHNLFNIKRVNSTKGIFVFKSIPSEVISEYDLGKMLVEPIVFNNAIKRLTTSVRRTV